MHTRIKVKSDDLFLVAEEFIADDLGIWLNVTGGSMFPFLNENTDQVYLEKPMNPERGDMILFRRETSKEYVLHRVVKQDHGYYYVIGDAQQWIEGPIKGDQVIATVTKIRKGSKEICCNNSLLRYKVRIWMCVIPCRYVILKFIRGCNKLKKIIRVFLEKLSDYFVNMKE